MLLIARSTPTLAATLQRFADDGVDCYGLAISAVETFAQKKPTSVDALILTSSNALASLPKNALNLPVYAVGESTAKLAKQLGFEVAYVGSSDARTMAAELPKDKHYWHPHATNASIKWHKEFGLKITATPAYSTHYISDLPSDLVMKWKQIEAVALFSPASARCLAKQARRYGLVLPPVLCFSENVAAALPTFSRTYICDSPSLQSMLTCWHEFKQKNTRKAS